MFDVGIDRERECEICVVRQRRCGGKSIGFQKSEGSLIMIGDVADYAASRAVRKVVIQ